MNKTCHVLRHCCLGGKWWDHNKPMTKRVLAGTETHLKKSCHGSKESFQIYYIYSKIINTPRRLTVLVIIYFLIFKLIF